PDCRLKRLHGVRFQGARSKRRCNDAVLQVLSTPRRPLAAGAGKRRSAHPLPSLLPHVTHLKKITFKVTIMVISGN
ncbi:hypothetical protein, partial [Stenotrophomonas muris]